MRKIFAEDLAKDDYLEFSTYTLEDQAVPCVYDNCKPVQRRILYETYRLGLTPTAMFKKSAYVIGSVMGRYHPFGPDGIYGAIVTMVKDVSKQVPLLYGKGGYGDSVSKDYAAYRYTGVKLSDYSFDYLLKDIDKKTVPFIDNYDDTLKEPLYLPAVIPDILINGNSGIATPYMCWIPPHNPVDVIKLCIAYVKDPKMSIKEMISILKAPDFPTGGVVSQLQNVYRFYNTGEGAITISGKWHKEVADSKTYIVIDEMPYMRSLDTFMEQLSRIKTDKEVGYLIAGVDDLSADGRVCVKIRVSTGTKYDELLEVLLKKTCLRYSQVMKMTVLLENKKYRLLNLAEVMEAFVGFRSKCLYNKFKYEIDTNNARLHILDGLVVINKDIDKAIAIVRKSSGKEDSIVKIMKEFKLTREQAEYIVMMRVYRLSNLEMKNVEKEMDDLKKRAKVLTKLTASERNKYLDEEMLKEWTEILDKKVFNSKRKTEILKG